MKWVKVALVAVAVLVLFLSLVAYLLPRHPRVERSIVVQARPATVFALVNGFERAHEWSPWTATDPAAAITYDGPAFGLGAKMAWKGDPKTIGEGRQEIVLSEPYERVRTRLEVGWGSPAITEFHLVPGAASTEVTWTFQMDLGLNPLARYFGWRLEKAVGPDFERGLANLKQLAERLPGQEIANLPVEQRTVEPSLVAYVDETCSTDEAEIAETLARAFAAVDAFIAAHGLEATGPPMTINDSWDDTGYRFAAARPIARAPEREAPAESSVQVKRTYGGKALHVIHHGTHRTLASTYEQLFAWAEIHGHDVNGPAWDVYVTDPRSTPESELETEIYLPVK